MGPTMKDVNGVSIIGKASKSRDEGMYLKKEKKTNKSFPSTQIVFYHIKQ